MPVPATWTNHLGHDTCTRCGQVRPHHTADAGVKRDADDPRYRCQCADTPLPEHGSAA